ncbi:SDR family NAD(P)-dependent oxidoreductase [Pandoraea anhela]|uniref:Short-chain dehydrogenase/reductase SDR n=1 Tax=Pandoraea anhela TaxID=2508295 RepID=A0A5E4WUC4_9BURK|nr:SDR family oxidoreductase [Pandoraea anhela]VVE26496.1 short-chain dehydrogenase/reductase SDR [Pandoraea anhela]
MSKLQGKVAVITGGATGIGLASAKRFVAEGAQVYIFGRRQASLDAALSELGGAARGIQGDVTNLNDLDRLFETVETEAGSLDVLFANAGIGELATLEAITPEHYARTFDINVKGTLFTVQRGLPLLKRGSSIILTGSTVGVMGTPSMSVYSASKAAVRNFARSWAQDLRGTGIRVNVLSPGPTQTEAVKAFLDDNVLEALVQATPLGRMGAPSETAAVAAFLASDDSSFMTGSEVFVDGGFAQI